MNLNAIFREDADDILMTVIADNGERMDVWIDEEGITCVPATQEDVEAFDVKPQDLTKWLRYLASGFTTPQPPGEKVDR